MTKIRKINRKKQRKEFACIENAYLAAKSMNAEGVLVIPFNGGEPYGWLYNAGRSKANELGIKRFLTANGLLD